MWLREWTMMRAVTMGVLALLVPGAIVIETPRAAASECNCGGDCAGAYCSSTPRLEELGGWSLFWHDPCSTPSYCWHRERYCHTAEGPRVYASVDFLPLFRDESGSTVYQALAFREIEEIRDADGELTDNIITYRREAALTSGDLDGGFEPGMRATMGVALGDWYRLEATYFGSYSWSDSATVRYDARDAIGNLLSPFSNFGDPEGVLSLDPVPDGVFQGVEGLDFNDRASISWSSQLENYELNLRRRVDMPPNPHVAGEISVLLGLRYMKLRESLDYYTESQLPDEGTENTESVHVDNDLFGPQIGALAQFLVHNRAWFDLGLKGAILFDRAESSVAANVHPDPVPSVAMFSGEEDATSFLGDLSLKFNYQFAASGTVHVGYNAMWLAGVALASENFVSDIETLRKDGPGSVDHDGNVVFHGPSIGLTWAR
jgi:hypothetical protein